MAKDGLAEHLLELGQLYCDRGDFKTASDKLSQASERFLAAKQFDRYLRGQQILLRIYAEMDDSRSIQLIKENLQNLTESEGVQLNPKIFYTLALCSSYKGNYKIALEFLEKSLALALSQDNKQDICYAISGLASVYAALGRYDDAIKEIYNLDVFFQVLSFPEIKLSSMILNGHILRKLGKYDQAIEIFNRCYELARENKSVYMFANLLCNVALTYADMGDKNHAFLHLSMARKLVDPNNLKVMSRAIDEKLKSLGFKEETTYDLVIDSGSNVVVEKKKGKVDFKSQFILMDLLKLFLENPGYVYSKETLVKKVWKQEYDPGVHDNKIYVTIKRLRKLLEPDYEKPRYIFRAKNGYYLNKNVKVLVDGPH